MLLSPLKMNVKPEIKFGLLAGTALIAWTIAQYMLGFHTTRLHIGYYSGYGMYAFILLALWMGLREKNADKGYKMTFRMGIRTGLILLLIAAGTSSAFMFLYDYKINPLWVDSMINFQLDTDKDFSLSRLANDSNASAIILSNTEMHLCVYFLSIILSGMAITVAITAILRMIPNRRNNIS